MWEEMQKRNERRSMRRKIQNVKKCKIFIKKHFIWNDVFFFSNKEN